MVKGAGNMVVDWIWKLCNIAFESDVVPEDLGSAVVVSLYKGKGEMIKSHIRRFFTKNPVKSLVFMSFV